MCLLYERFKNAPKVVRSETDIEYSEVLDEYMKLGFDYLELGIMVRPTIEEEIVFLKECIKQKKDLWDMQGIPHPIYDENVVI